MEEKMKENTKKNGIGSIIGRAFGFSLLVMAFGVISLILDIGLLYSFGLDDLITEHYEEMAEMKNEISDLKSKIDPKGTETKDISVVDVTNCSFGEKRIINIKLPKITGNSETITKINEKMLNEAIECMYDKENVYQQVGAFDKGISFNYRYLTNNNVLVIYVYSTIPEGSKGFPGSGDGMMYSIYFYDIEEDKELTLVEAATKMKLSLDGVTTVWDEKGTPIESYDKLEENGYSLIIDENNEPKFQFFN